MKKLLFLLFLLGFAGARAQQLNDYKYVIIPERFEFSKEKNQHQLNALAKFLFEKEGFKTLMKHQERPEELQQDPCLALLANVENNSGLFMTRFNITLEDCQGNKVFASEEGISREKEYQKAWHEAFRDAFSSIAAQDYHFDADAPPAIQKVEEEEPKEKAEVAVPIPEREKGPELDLGPELDEEGEIPATAPELHFSKEGKGFYLEENENGYALYQEGMAEPFALLIRSEEGSSFIYNSLSKQGLAYFSENGNLVVEHFDPSAGKKVREVYRTGRDQ